VITSLSLGYDELLRYTNEERQKWHDWLLAHPEAMEIPVQRGGQFPTMGKLIDHIFLGEHRFVQRLTGARLVESTGLTGSNVPPLFAYGASVRRELDQFIATLDADAADESRTFVIRDQTWQLTPRKILFHVLLHETRHWAQIALAVRQAGLQPPGNHDLLFSRALK
jgi:uncharacterized damage-inducible protein DinB